MKFTFKNILPISLGVCATMLVSSCDSEPFTVGTSPLDFPDAVTEALTSLVPGDSIEYTSSTPSSSVIEQLTFVAPNTAETFGAPPFFYEAIGPQEFTLTAVFGSQVNLTTALDVALGDPSPLGTQIRDILLIGDADNFTNADLVDIVTLLNPLGAELAINPDNPLQLVATAERRILQQINSTNIDQFEGVQAGVYEVEDVSFIVNFREPSLLDLEQFRFITTQTRIPQVSTTLIDPFVSDAGTWVLNFTNI